ncbi:MAG: hypothetical protein M0Z78_08830 [Betaproteobacteria bacterium]|nr:hypothetical protein [Betaproteobacteria bacterium]
MVLAVCEMQKTIVGEAREVLVWDGGEDEGGDTVATESLLIDKSGRWFLAKAGSADTHSDVPIEFITPVEVCEWLARRSA